MNRNSERYPGYLTKRIRSFARPSGAQLDLAYRKPRTTQIKSPHGRIPPGAGLPPAAGSFKSLPDANLSGPAPGCQAEKRKRAAVCVQRAQRCACWRARRMAVPERPGCAEPAQGPHQLEAVLVSRDIILYHPNFTKYGRTRSRPDFGKGPTETGSARREHPLWEPAIIENGRRRREGGWTA